MAIFPMLIDGRPAYLGGGSASLSLLLSPMGTHTLLHCMCAMMADAADEPPCIATTFAIDAQYAAKIGQSSADVARVVPLDRIDELLNRLEPSDWLLAVDTRHCLADRSGLRRLVTELAESHEARHLVVMENSTKEYVQLDARRRVQRIQRYYDGVTWLQTRTVVASLAPGCVAGDLPNDAFRDLATLREVLVADGVISRDVGWSGDYCDLDRESELLRMCERHLGSLLSGPMPSGYRAPARAVWIGPGCHVHPSARLYGPVVLQGGVDVAENVKLIGPVLVGAGARVGRDATLARCLVVGEAVVPNGALMQGSVFGGGDRGSARTTQGAFESSWFTRQSQWRHYSSRESPRRADPGHQRRARYIVVKRMAESAVAALGLIVLSPLLLAIAIAIKLGSRGPVFFRHEREGKDGRPFRCCKFRTMVAGAHRRQRDLYRDNAVDGPQFKLAHDPRITRLGRWLRASNLDELPQLFNVVLGQMSLIGPRPSPFRENQICVPWRRARLAVRPGITGLWQICRHSRSAGDFHQWIHFDMLYVRHISPWLDIKILLATVLTLGGRRSVPVRWLIPIRRLRSEHDLAAIA